MLSSTIIKIGEYMYRVYPFTSQEKLEAGNAYTFGGKMGKLSIKYNYVLPFRGRYNKDAAEPGIYIDKHEDMKVLHPITAAEKITYSISRILEINPGTISTELDKYLKEVDINDLRYNGNIFAPKITENDDVGIKAVRLALLAKEIDFSSYKNRFSKPWAVSNARKALLSDNTLTFTKLAEYAQIFDFSFGVMIFDKQNAKDPMNPDGKALMVFNDEEFDLSGSNVIVARSVEDIIGDEEIQYTEIDDENE